MASWQPVVTTTASGGTSIPSSLATVRAISSWMIPLVRPYWNNWVRTWSRDQPRVSSRWLVYVCR